MRPNKLRELLDADKPSICVRVNTVWPDVIEWVGQMGLYDYVEFAAEYGPYDLHDLDNLCRAAELYGLSTMIKIDQASRCYFAQRAIGAGFQSVLFTDCRTVDEVRYCVQVCRPDTPEDKGLFGAAARRFAYDSSGPEEFNEYLRNVVVDVMVEKAALVEDLDEALAVPGLDMIQWGPSDYQMSSGNHWGRNSAEIREIEERVIKTALKNGVQPRAELVSLDGIERYLELGVKHFRIGTDVSILQKFWSENGKKLRGLVSSL